MAKCGISLKTKQKTRCCPDFSKQHLIFALTLWNTEAFFHFKVGNFQMYTLLIADFFVSRKDSRRAHFRSAHKMFSYFTILTFCSCFSRNTVPIGFCCGGFSSTAGYVPGNEAHFAMSDFCSPSWWFLAKKCCSFLSEQLGKSLSTFS